MHIHGTYTQYIRETQTAWAKLPKAELLNEIITMDEALPLIRDDDGPTLALDRDDLDSGNIVYLAGGTCLRRVGADQVRHWQ